MREIRRGVSPVFLYVYFFFFLLLECLVSRCEHQLDAVELVDLAGSRIVIDRNDIRLGVYLFDRLYDALADDVIRQASEGLYTYDVRRSALDKMYHFSREEPALAELVTR